MAESDPYWEPQASTVPKTRTLFCGVCGKQKRRNQFARRALHRDSRGAHAKCDACVLVEEEDRLPSRLIAVHAQWEQRMPREAGFAVGDRAEVEGQELTVWRVDELAREPRKPEIRVLLKPWSGEGPPPQRNRELLAKIREANERKRKRKPGGAGRTRPDGRAGTAEQAETGPDKPREPEPAWPGQRYYARGRDGRETEVRALRRTDFALAVSVGQLVVAPPRKGGRRPTRYVVAAVEDGGDRVVLEREG